MNGLYPGFIGGSGDPIASLYPDWLGDSFFTVAVEDEEYDSWGPKFSKSHLRKLARRKSENDAGFFILFRS